MPDGGWSFDHHAPANCRGQCRNQAAHPGAQRSHRWRSSPSGATRRTGRASTKSGQRGALLPDHADEGLARAEACMRRRAGCIHGLASIALCEAYAMTRDRAICAAQQAVNTSRLSQDPIGGGWRFTRSSNRAHLRRWLADHGPEERYMAYLQIPGETVAKASLFLNTVQAKNSAAVTATPRRATRRQRPRSACFAACTWAGTTTHRPSLTG